MGEGGENTMERGKGKGSRIMAYLMFDMEVVKYSFMQALVNSPPLLLWSTLGVCSLRNGPSTSSTFSIFFWVIGKSQAYLEKQSMILTASSLDRAITGFCTLSHQMH